MSKTIRKKALAESLLRIGIVSIILGGGILFSVAGGGTRMAALPASVCLASGVLLSLVSVKLRRGARYLFLATFMILTGLLLSCIAGGLVPHSVFRLWPLLSVFAGLSLFPAGFLGFAGFRARFVVPALAFIVLGGVFLVFSFDLIPFSFSRFIREWWPLLLVLAGVLLVLAALGARASGTEESGR